MSTGLSIGNLMDTAELEARLDAIDIADDPDAWAVAAYRLAVARSELATTVDDLAACVDLLDKAGRILSAARAPLEHGRIATVVGHCHRSAGRPDLAVEDFRRAAELLRGRGDVLEEAAALANVGLGLTESGRPGDAVEPLSEAIELLTSSTGTDGTVGAVGGAGVVDRSTTPGPADDHRRTLGAALVNRAQARQATSTADGMKAAVGDYLAATDVLDDASPQAAMAWHGLATALLERDEPGDAARAVAAIERSLAVFSVNAFPFQHAVARHSMAVALTRSGCDAEQGPSDTGFLDLARAVHHGEAALAVFDPRLHTAQRRAVDELLTTIDGRLGNRTRQEAVLQLMVAADDEERTQLLRDRLAPLAHAPDVRVERDLHRLCRALTQLDPADHQVVVRTLVSVLMELPDRILEHAVRALVAANRASPDAETYDRSIDDAVQTRLFGPQRVRVRDLLEEHGWIRP